MSSILIYIKRFLAKIALYTLILWSCTVNNLRNDSWAGQCMMTLFLPCSYGMWKSKTCTLYLLLKRYLFIFLMAIWSSSFAVYTMPLASLIHIRNAFALTFFVVSEKEFRHKIWVKWFLDRSFRSHISQDEYIAKIKITI